MKPSTKLATAIMAYLKIATRKRPMYHDSVVSRMNSNRLTATRSTSVGAGVSRLNRGHLAQLRVKHPTRYHSTGADFFIDPMSTDIAACSSRAALLTPRRRCSVQRHSRAAVSTPRLARVLSLYTNTPKGQTHDR